MNALEIVSSQAWVERLGWTLVDFLWQGAVVAAFYAAARRWARNASSSVRYGLACAALASMLAAPIVTWSAIEAASAPEAARPHAALLLHTAGSAAAAAWAPTGYTVPVRSPESVSGAWPSQLFPIIVAAWLAGAMVFSIRLFGGWAVAARMRSVSVRPAPAEWQAKLKSLAARVRVSRPVRFLVSGVVEVPAVLGWLRPVVLVPAGALAGLPPEQLEALLLHELAHIRRHDALVNMLESAAEALLFYHPAVWWISGQIRAEREACCDDIAAAVSGDAFTYARALVEFETARAPRASALAANGASLSRRIARLLGEPRTESRTFSLSGAMVSAAVLLAMAWGLFGQTEAGPRFDVASIKANKDAAAHFRGMRPLAHGRLTATNVTVKMLIGNAYGIQAYQIIGGPAWMDTDGFDIEARGDQNANRDQVLLMLRSLLEDRFQLRFRRESRQLPVYTLSVGKNGPKLPAPEEGACVTINPESGTPPPPPGPGRMSMPCGSPMIAMTPSGVSVEGGKVPMKEFLRILQIVLGRPVLDKTGIAGPFDVNLKFTRDDVTAGLPSPMQMGGPMPAGAAPPPPVDPDPGAPPILTAIQEQLGLKLESTKGPVEALVIDHVEKPSEN